MPIFIVLISGFVLLIKGADFLVTGSSALAKRIGVSDLVIGLTVVAFGTSTPEMIVNIFASMEGRAGIAIGNIVGSNLFNILFILGISSMIYPLSVVKGTVWKEIPFSLLAAIMAGLLANDYFLGQEQSLLSRSDGLVFLAFFAVFLYYIFSVARDQNSGEAAPEGRPEKLFKSLLKISAGLLGLVIGGKFVVDGAVDIAQRMGVSESLIGLTIVAAGTSLPELATSAVAACKKNSDIAVGNVVGSNIFNIFFILGVSSLIRPIPVASGINLDILILTAASFILFIFMFTGKTHRLDRWEGAAFVVAYAGYLIFLVKRG